jgi:glycosyltransferase involved in cell wall biosynthesis
VLPSPPRDRLVLSYAGTVYRLTSPQVLLRAVRKLHTREPELAKLLEVRFIGRVVDTELEAFEGMEALGVKRLGYVPHGEVLARLGASHMVMVIQSDHPGGEGIYPGKVFELMKLGRPILTISPTGELTRLVEELGLGVIFQPHDEDGLCTFLEQRLRAFQAQSNDDTDSDEDASVYNPIDPASIAPYHRRALAGRWADALRTAVVHRHSGPVRG